MKTFNQEVYRIVNQIPVGKVLSYGQIARLIGSPMASRAVGYALHALPEGSKIPWQRVVLKDGSLAALPGGNKTQYQLLKKEKCTFTKDKKVNMKKCNWDMVGVDFFL